MTSQLKFVTTISLSLFLAFISISPALAQGRQSQRPSPSVTPKLQACQAKEASLKTRSGNLNRMAANMLDQFDVIAKRVQDYYVRSGKSVASYDSLVDVMATKRAAVQTALSKAQADISGFNCNIDNPKSRMTQFQADMKAVKAALSEYRTAIKNLIVAVRSVSDEEPKKSPNINANPNSQRKGSNQ